MAEHSETWAGGLTVPADSDGTDSYDFGSRAAAVTSLKSGLRLAGDDPATVTLDARNRAHLPV